MNKKKNINSTTKISLYKDQWSHTEFNLTLKWEFVIYMLKLINDLLQSVRWFKKCFMQVKLLFERFFLRD